MLIEGEISEEFLDALWKECSAAMKREILGYTSKNRLGLQEVVSKLEYKTAFATKAERDTAEGKRDTAKLLFCTLLLSHAEGQEGKDAELAALMYKALNLRVKRFASRSGALAEFIERLVFRNWKCAPDWALEVLVSEQ